MSVIKTYQARSRRVMKRERITQAMRSFLSRLDPAYDKLYPKPLIEVVNAPVEGHQIFQRVLARNDELRLCSYHMRIT